jgi:hypothetical protein
VQEKSTTETSESRKDEEKEKDLRRTEVIEEEKDFNAEGAERQSSLGREYERKQSTEEAGARDYGVAGGLFLRDVIGYASEFLLDYAGEFGHLFFHFQHLFAHIQDDFDAGEVYAHVAGQREDYVQALQVFVGVQAGVAFRA